MKSNNNDNLSNDAKQISVQEVLDKHPLSFFQYRTIFLAFFIVMYVGYTSAEMGFIGSALATDLHVSPAQLNPTMVASLIGLAIGSFMAGPLADKLGRKNVLLAAVALFGVFSVLASQMDSVMSIAAMRLVVGLGLGAAMPIAVTLVSEYSPTKLRSFLVAVMFCGFTAGSAGVGFVASALLPDYGWQGVLSVGGWVALVTLIPLIILLPESAKYLAEKNKSTDKIRSYLNKIGSVPATVEHFTSDHNVAAKPANAQKTSAMSKLFNAELGTGTVMLWVIFFMTMAYIGVYTNWLPMMFGLLGYEQAQSATLAALFQIGGTVGALIIGMLMDRVSPYKALGVSLLVGTVFTAAMAFYNSSYAAIFLGFLIIGVTISGGMVGFNALAAAFYPTSARATGVSWALGVGRFGSISGSLIGGYLLDQQMSFGGIMSLLIIPVIVTTVLIFYMGVRYDKRKA